MKIAPSIPLTGSDFFSLAMERRARDSEAGGNVCRLVLRLDGHLDAETLRAAIRRSGFHEWLSNVRWSRTVPFTVPRWRSDGGGNQIVITEETRREAFDISTIDAAKYAKVNPFYPPGFAFDLLHHPDGSTTLLFIWHHSLMDAKGAELLLGLIGRAAGKELPVISDIPPSLPQSLMLWLKMPARVAFARKSIHAIVRSCRPPIASLLRATSGWRGSQRSRAIAFDLEQTRLIEKNCVVAGANFKSSLFCLAATIRALHAVLAGRSGDPAAYVVPVALDNRRRGQKGPIISNHLTFLFYRADPDDLTPIKRLIGSLSSQMKEQIENRTTESYATAMDLFRNLPIGLFALLVNRPTNGQVASFFFSYTGEISSDLDSFMNLQVAEVRHLPPASSPPGLSVSFSRHKGKLHAVLSYIEGCLSAGELVLLENSLRSELLNHEDTHRA